MVSQIEELKNRLKELEPIYKPGDQATKAIGDVILGNIIGPSGVGKSSINHLIAQIDPDFSVPLGFTTRPPRPDEKLKPYRHIPDTAEGWAGLLQKAEAGELVQYSFHATTGMVYGTEPQDYLTKYSVLDMQFQFVEKTRALGFKAVKDVAIVTTPTGYDKQLQVQSQLIDNPADMEKRRQEGILCLSWCLNQDSDIMWAHNRYGQLEQSALEVIGLIKGQLKPDPGNRRLGQRLLKHLQRT